MLLMLHLSLFGRQYPVSFHRISQSFQRTQVMDGLSCDFPKDYILEIEEWTWGKRNDESTVVGILLTHTAQQSRSIMRQLEGLISEVWAKDGAISTLKMTELHKCSRYQLLEIISDKG